MIDVVAEEADVRPDMFADALLHRHAHVPFSPCDVDVRAHVAWSLRAHAYSNRGDPSRPAVPVRCKNNLASPGPWSMVRIGSGLGQDYNFTASALSSHK